MKIPGYNIITDNRNYSVAGGVAPYLKSNFCHRISDHLKIDGVENTWVDTQDLLIGVIFTIHLIGPIENFLMNYNKFCLLELFDP